jgi:hypothetical protein
MNLDAYMDDFGRELKRARPPRPKRALIVAPAALALTAAGVIALPRGDGIDAIAEARQALAPKDEIVHMVVQIKPPANARGPHFVIPKTEQWYSAAQNRWRTRTELVRGPHGHAADVEQIYADDSIRFYDKKRDVVTIMRGIKMVVPVGSTGPGVTGGDPATDLRKQLDAGDLRDDGVVSHDGRQVRRLVREQKIGKRNTQRFIYYMDPQTFAPLGGRMYFSLGSRRTFMSEFVISGYERIPLNAESEKLLRFDKTPNTQYVWRDARTPKHARPGVRVR